MAKFITLTTSVSITDEGEEVVPSSVGFAVAEAEIEEYNQGTYRVTASGDKFIGVTGSVITGETDPVVVPLSIIEGYQLQSNYPITVSVDGAAAGVQVTVDARHGMQASSLKFEGAGQVADVKLLIWGKR